MSIWRIRWHSAAIPLPKATGKSPRGRTGTGPEFFGTFGGARAAGSLTFLSQTAMEADLPATLDLQSVPMPVQTRTLNKRSMVHNDALPRIEVDPETYEVRADGELLTCEPAVELPMAQHYFLF